MSEFILFYYNIKLFQFLYSRKASPIDMNFIYIYVHVCILWVIYCDCYGCSVLGDGIGDFVLGFSIGDW